MVATRSTLLHSPFSFSYMRRGGKSKAAAAEAEAADPNAAAADDAPAAADTTSTENVNPYETSIKSISSIHTVEGFWNTYDYLKRPNDLTPTTDYHCFREGIKPTWEDPGNAKGGKWIIRLPKGLASRYWEEIVLALIGGQFLGVPLEEICGAVLSVRYSEDILGVWNRHAADRDVVEKIRDAIKKILQLPTGGSMLEYKPHQNSLQDRSSFRNTQVWKPKSERTRSSWTDPTKPGTTSSSGSSERARSGSGSWTDATKERPRSGSWTDRDASTSTNTTNPKPRRDREIRGSWRNTSGT